MPRVTAASRTDRGGTEASLRASRYRRLRETTAGRALRTPLDPDPLLDFLGRLGAVSYVLEPSGRTITYTAHHLRHHLYPSTIGAVFGGSGQFPDEWSGLRLVAVLPPLRPGAYTASVSITFERDWCDGSSDDPLACLPAGTTPLYSRDFTAVAPR